MFTGPVLQHRIEDLALNLAQSPIHPGIELIMDRLAQGADLAIQGAERREFDPVLDQGLDRRADQVRRVAHDLGGAVHRFDHDLATAVGERTAAEVLADCLAVSVQRRCLSHAIQQLDPILETEPGGDV
jgi:hypothetical protein